MDASVVTYRDFVATASDVFASGISAVLVDGPPGIGKTAAAAPIQRALGFANRFMMKPGHHDVVDFQGCPVPDHATKTTHFFPSADLLPPADLVGGCVMVWDEIGDAPTPNQNLVCQAIFEGGLHGYTFPKDTVHLLTANRVSDRSGANRIVTKLGNRVAWYTLQPAVDEVYNYGVSNNWDPAILAFLKMKGDDPINPNAKMKAGTAHAPTYFNSFDPNDPAQLVKPVFASSRSIEFASRLMNHINRTAPGMKDGPLLTRLSGIVGTPWATAFVPFRSEAMAMPDPDAILRGDAVPFPTKQAVLWTLVTTLVTRADKKSVKHLYKWLRQGPAEFRIYAIRLLFDCRLPQVAGPELQEILKEPDVRQALTAK